MRRELEAIMAADWPRIEDTAKLGRLLCDRCYNHSILDPPPPPITESENILPALTAANQSHPSWEEGWIIDQRLEDGSVLARKGRAARSFQPGEFITSRGLDRGPDPDDAVRVFIAPGSPDLQTAFYFAFGEAIEELGGSVPTLRVYWNIAPEGATVLMETLTREFNRFQVPFRFKCLRHVAHYSRRDPAILYVSRRSYPIVALLIEKIYPTVRAWLRAAVPLFTKPVANGLGFAEDPGDSFGSHRSRILAEAVALSHGQPVEQRLDELRRQFAQRGISLDTPWLGPASPETYEFPFPVA
jgi:hypothetical protein